jgi:hypothetical protein
MEGTSLRAAVTCDADSAVLTASALSPGWEAIDEMRAMASAIPADQRQEVLAKMRALIFSAKTDTNMVSLSA